MLDEGRVLRQGPLHTLLASDTVEVELFDDPDLMIKHLTAAGAAVDRDGHRLTVSVADGDVNDLILDAVVTSGAGIRRMGTRAQSLEDVYLRTGDQP